MPHRLKGNCVQHKVDGNWETLHCYDNKNDALDYLAALNINIKSYYTNLVRSVIKEYMNGNKET
jgi:hypothetical protein